MENCSLIGDYDPYSFKHDLHDVGALLQFVLAHKWNVYLVDFLVGLV